MEELRSALTDSARVLGVSCADEIFRAALAVGSEAIASGLDTDTATELARRVLLDALAVNAA